MHQQILFFIIGFYIGCFGLYFFKKWRFKKQGFTTGSGTYVGGGRAGGQGGSSTINDTMAPGQPGDSNGEGGQGGIVLTNGDGVYTRVYYNEKGEKVIERFRP